MTDTSPHGWIARRAGKQYRAGYLPLEPSVMVPAGCVEVELTRGFFTIIDSADWPATALHYWYARKKGRTNYVKSNDPSGEVRTIVTLHAKLVTPGVGLMVDHIDGNGLNNRRCNLRMVTPRVNTQNRHTVKTSIFPGVCWNKRNKRWHAAIRLDGKKKYLGYFKVEQDAADAYRKACPA